MTLDELAAVPGEVLTLAQVAPLTGFNQDTLRGQARECPEMLGFPVIVAGSGVRVPKRAFIRFMREGIRER